MQQQRWAVSVRAVPSRTMPVLHRCAKGILSSRRTGSFGFGPAGFSRVHKYLLDALWNMHRTSVK